MRQVFGWLLFMIGVGALGFWGQSHHAYIIEDRIEAELLQALPDDLDTRVTAMVSGRDITITGQVASEDERIYLTELARSIRGHREIRNVVDVRNR